MLGLKMENEKYMLILILTFILDFGEFCGRDGEHSTWIPKNYLRAQG